VCAEEPASLRVAFIIDVYPKLSLTFIDQEVEKLRHLGMQIDLYAVWRPRPGNSSGEVRSLMDSTTYLSVAPITQLLRAHYYYARRVPGRYLTVLKLCLGQHSSARLRLRTLYNFILAPRLAASLEQKRIRHIHAHFASGASTIGMMVAGLARIDFSFTAHGSGLLVEKVLLSEKTRKAKFVIAVSEYNRQRLLHEAPTAEPSRIKTIHYGVDPDVFSPGGSRKVGGPFVLTAIGNLVWHKGHEYLIEACRLLKANSVDYRCVIVGDGPRRKELRSLILRYGIHREVAMVGAVQHEHIQRYLRESDLLVHPSVSEGIPVVLMEAMATGLPVIATNITGIPELVEDGQNGILVPPRDSMQLADATMRILQDSDLRLRLGRNARDTIVRGFHVDSRTGMVARLFDSELTL